jgi:hypothetical protein
MGALTYLLAGISIGLLIGISVGLLIARFAEWRRHLKKTRTAVDTRSCPQCYAYAGYWCRGLSGKRIHNGRRF